MKSPENKTAFLLFIFYCIGVFYGTLHFNGFIENLLGYLPLGVILGCYSLRLCKWASRR